MLGAGCGLSRATAYRDHAEGRAVLAAQAPELTAARDRVQDAGGSQVILDGSVVAADRDAASTTPRAAAAPLVRGPGPPAWREPAGREAS